MAQQQAAGKAFTDEQRWWLGNMVQHIASDFYLETDHFNYGPFDQAGRLCKSPCSNLHDWQHRPLRGD